MVDRETVKNLQMQFLVILLIFLAGCSSGERWEGHVYPDKGKLMIHHNSGEFDSLEACESASMEMLQSINALQKGYYECGKNCKSGSGYYIRDCKETVKGNLYK